MTLVFPPPFYVPSVIIAAGVSLVIVQGAVVFWSILRGKQTGPDILRRLWRDAKAADWTTWTEVALAFLVFGFSRALWGVLAPILENMINLSRRSLISAVPGAPSSTPADVPPFYILQALELVYVVIFALASLGIGLYYSSLLPVKRGILAGGALSLIWKWGDALEPAYIMRPPSFVADGVIWGSAILSAPLLVFLCWYAYVEHLRNVREELTLNFLRGWRSFFYAWAVALFGMVLIGTGSNTAALVWGNEVNSPLVLLLSLLFLLLALLLRYAPLALRYGLAAASIPSLLEQITVSQKTQITALLFLLLIFSFLVFVVFYAYHRASQEKISTTQAQQGEPRQTQQ
jgi:ABC-type multidrug transport system fused ATPase/permease subunit